MSTNENNPLSPDSSLVPAVAGRSPLAATLSGAASWPAGASRAEFGGSISVMSCLHGLRRHWLVATSLGIVCGAIFAVVGYLSRGPQYTATAILHVAPVQTPIVFKTTETDATSLNAYEGFKETQRLLIRSRLVLGAAVRRPEITVLPSIRRAEPDPVGWLAGELHADFPNKGELMYVSLTGGNQQEVADLVNAVVSAYRSEVVDKDREQRIAHRDELDNLSAAKDIEVRNKRNELRQLAATIGSGDTETLSLKQQVAVQQYALFRQELVRVQFELMRTDGMLKTAKELMAGLEGWEVPTFEVDAYAQTDQTAKEMTTQLNNHKMLLDQLEKMMVPGAKSSTYKRYKSQADSIQKQIDDLGTSIREKIKARKRSENQKEINRLESERAVLAVEEEHLKEDVKREKDDAERLGTKSIDLEVGRVVLANMERVSNNIQDERAKLGVELNAPPRITQRQAAEKPEMETGLTFRVAIVVLAGLFGSLLPAVGIVVWDARSRRVNVSAEINRDLRLSVLGSLPVIPAPVLRRLGAPTKRSQVWRLRLTESVDGVAARLLRKADTEQTRVILISSAMPGEGKTTLATQVAMSLARHYRNTVLVDFDLRRPALDGVFGLPLQPGVCEALVNKGDVGGMVHATATEHLSVLPAGRWSRQAMAALANGESGSLFRQLREKFDFVIVDSSPLLPVADTRFVSQHVDAVVLSVRRDVSEMPKLQAACEIFEAFGVHNLETVVTGGGSFTYGRGREAGAGVTA